MSGTPKPKSRKARKIREVREVRPIRIAMDLGMPEDRAFIAVYDSLPVGNRGEWMRRQLLAGHAFLMLKGFDVGTGMPKVDVSRKVAPVAAKKLPKKLPIQPFSFA